jgi:hypothetical protein
MMNRERQMTHMLTIKLSKKEAQKQIDDLLAEFIAKGNKGTELKPSKRRVKTFGRR